MKNYKKTLLKLLVRTTLVLLILITLFIFWLYIGKLNTFKQKVLSYFPFPMAFVNGKPVPFSDYILRINVNKKLDGTLSVSEIYKYSYSAVIENALTEEIAYINNIRITNLEINSELQKRSNQILFEGKNTFSELLSSYDINENIYKENIIKPDLLNFKLKLWFNSQKDLNTSAYTQANFILEQIQQGKDMELLAKIYSQDEVEKSIGGDLGFLDITELLPELQEGVEGIKEGEAKIFPSRYGLHIIKIEEINSNKVHIRQIYLKTEDFNSWINKEKEKIQIIKLLKI